MNTRSISFLVSPSIGSVSAECIVPEKTNCIMTLAHGAGRRHESSLHDSAGEIT
jgi:uncharacterized protein